MFKNVHRRAAASLLLTGVTVIMSFPLSAAAAPRNVTFGQDVGLGGAGIAQGDPGIAYNPASPSDLVAVFTDANGAGAIPASECRAAFTAMGGKGWKLGGATPLELRAGSTNVQCGFPSIAADEQGNFYVAYLNGSSSRTSFTSEVFVAKSENEGKAFSTHSVIFDGSTGRGDKPSIAVDNWPASPFRGSVYVAYTNFGFGTTEVMQAARSRDGGATWSSPADISTPVDTQTPVGASTAIAPDGTVFVFWSLFTPTSRQEDDHSVHQVRGWRGHLELARGGRLASPESRLVSAQERRPRIPERSFCGPCRQQFPERGDYAPGSHLCGVDRLPGRDLQVAFQCG